MDIEEIIDDYEKVHAEQEKERREIGEKKLEKRRQHAKDLKRFITEVAEPVFKDVKKTIHNKGYFCEVGVLTLHDMETKSPSMPQSIYMELSNLKGTAGRPKKDLKLFRLEFAGDLDSGSVTLRTNVSLHEHGGDPHLPIEQVDKHTVEEQISDFVKEAFSSSV